MQTILLVGLDPSLLSSRAAVLNRTGCRTVAADVQDAVALLEQQGAEVVVLCHTLPGLTALGLTRLVHERWPSTRVLQVLPHGEENLSGYATSADAVSYSRPEYLMKITTELLRRMSGPPVEISERKDPGVRPWSGSGFRGRPKVVQMDDTQRFAAGVTHNERRNFSVFHQGQCF
jgi:DNA-binding response OmpR family regulator